MRDELNAAAVPGLDAPGTAEAVSSAEDHHLPPPTAPDGPVPAYLGGTIVDASYMGVSTQYIVQTSSGSRVMVYEQNMERTTRERLWARGDQVHLTWSPDNTFVVEAPDAPAAESVA